MFHIIFIQLVHWLPSPGSYGNALKYLTIPIIIIAFISNWPFAFTIDPSAPGAGPWNGIWFTGGAFHAP